jgi:hypothetical protein
MHSSRKRLQVLVVIAALVALATACQLLAGIEERTERTPDATTQPQTETAPPPDAPIDLPKSCASVGTPPVPTGVVDDNMDKDYVFALRHIDFGLDGGLVGRELNLDRRCTCPEPDTCLRDATTPVCDGEGGADNATKGAVETLIRFAPGIISEDQMNQNLRDGVSGALIRIQRYGGAANDPAVKVSYYSATGFEGPGKPTGAPTDAWTLEESTVVPATLEPKYFTDDGYVTDNTVVASFEVPLEIGGNNRQKPLRLLLKGGVVVAKLNLQDGTIRGVIAGRWQTTSILETVETFLNPNIQNSNICRGSTEFDFAKTLVCNNADIASDTAEGRQCNSLSTIIGFEGALARFGKVTRRAAVPSSCEAGLQPPTCN